jgi:hypothetical protein
MVADARLHTEPPVDRPSAGWAGACLARPVARLGRFLVGLESSSEVVSYRQRAAEGVLELLLLLGRLDTVAWRRVLSWAVLH